MALSSAEVKTDKEEFGSLLAAIGLCYLVGTAGASSYHFLKKFLESPKGTSIDTRIFDGIQSAITDGPATVNSLFVNGAFYTGTLLIVGDLRHQRHGAWNCFIAGTATGMLHRYEPTDLTLKSLKSDLIKCFKSGLRWGAAASIAHGVWFVTEKTCYAMEKGDLSVTRPLLVHTAEWFTDIFHFV